MLSALALIATVIAPPFAWIEGQIDLPFELHLHDSKEVVLEKLNRQFAPCHSEQQRVNGLTGEVWIIRCPRYIMTAAGFTSDKGHEDVFGLSEIEIGLNESEPAFTGKTQSLVAADATNFSPDKAAFLAANIYAITTPPFFRKGGAMFDREVVMEINKYRKTILFQEWMAWDRDVRVKFVDVNSTNPQICFGMMCHDVTVSSPSYGGGRGGADGCGSRGGPGIRKANGQCASWRDLGF